MSEFRRRLLMMQAQKDKHHGDLPGLVASYRTYGKTNADSDKDILKDLSGNGHDFRLQGFAWTDESGYCSSGANKGALVSDGVDDWGLCENFPVLEKSKGFTIMYLRKYLENIFPFSKSRAFLRNGTGFNLESYNQSNQSLWVASFGQDNKANDFFIKDLQCGYMTSNKYNGHSLIKGNSERGGNRLVLFDNDSRTRFGKIAFYALEIYNRDLSDEEIESAKARLVAEYEEKTGLKYNQE